MPAAYKPMGGTSQGGWGGVSSSGGILGGTLKIVVAVVVVWALYSFFSKQGFLHKKVWGESFIGQFNNENEQRREACKKRHK